MMRRLTNLFCIGRNFRAVAVLVMGAVSVGTGFGEGTILYENVPYQQQTVTGNVASLAGPVSGVTVVLKENPAVSTSTDDLGNFSIWAADGQTLVFTAVGFEPQEVKVSGSRLRVALVEQSETLEEIVVVGYGTQKRESLTGALQTVKGGELRDVTTASVENMLNGKAPGVFVSPGSGRPGARGGVVVRGQATLSGTTSPLWVIDGVIVGSGPGDLNSDDIASMTILKDAASTAIYGSQGANGVIVVTTKSAKAGKTTVDFSTKMGYNQLTNGNLEMMDGAELYDYYASFANAGTISFPRWNADLRNSSFDWWDLATKSGFTQNHNLTIHGGTDALRSLLSVGMYDEKGTVKGYDFRRYNVRLTQTYKPFDRLSVKPSLVAARRGVEDRQHSTTAMYANLPWDSPFDAGGNLVPHRSAAWVNTSSTNYLYDLQWNRSANTNYELAGNLDFDLKLADWLAFASVNNYRYNSYSSNGYTDPRSNGGLSVGGRLAEYRSEYARRYTSQILRANKTWGDHAVNGLVAYEFNDYTAKTLDVLGTGFLPGFEVLDVVSRPERTRGRRNEWAVQSLLSNVHYAYGGKYLAQVSFRRDGASNFGDSAKYGNFFSVSGGWNIDRENWFAVRWVDALKLRAAYGSVGNRPNALYPQYDLYSVSSTSGYNGNPGALISQKGNRNLSWEKTYTAGAGVDAAFLDNRARITLDYYVKDTDNILYQVPVSGTVGITSIWRNIGEMRNTGFELAVGGDIVRNENWLWSLDANIGHNKNKLVNLYPVKDATGNYVVRPVIIGDGLGIAGSAQRILEPGLPVDTYYLKEWAGVDPDNGAPLWHIVDRDANGNETARTTTTNYAQATFEKLGKASPKLFGGFSTVLQYKRFDLGAVFGYSIGGKIYNYSRQEYDSDGTYTDRNQMRLRPEWNRWEKPGDSATHPVAKYNNPDRGNRVSSRYIESSDFLRLRSLTLGYNLNLDQYRLKNVRLSLTGENLFVLTKYSGVDPEIPLREDAEASLGGTSLGTIIGSAGPGLYPATRRFMLGVNVSF